MNMFGIMDKVNSWRNRRMLKREWTFVAVAGNGDHVYFNNDDVQKLGFLDPVTGLFTTSN